MRHNVCKKELILLHDWLFGLIEKEENERERKRDWLTDWLAELYYPRIEVKARMPVGQPAIDTIYKHLKNNTNVNLDKNDDDNHDYNYSNHNSIEEKLHTISQLQVITTD